MLGPTLGEQDLEPFTLELLAWLRSLAPSAEAEALGAFQAAESAMTGYLSAFDVTLCPTLPIDVSEIGSLAPTLARVDILKRTAQLAGYAHSQIANGTVA